MRKVSVITPTYNCAKWLPETVESILSQPDVTEYLVINDGSTDNTLEVLARYADPRLKVITQPNRGEHESVSHGMLICQGDYFMVVNADDPLMPDCVKFTLAFMEARPDVTIGYPDWWIINEDGSRFEHIRVKEFDLIDCLRWHACYPGPGAIYRREVIGKVGLRNPSFRYLGDFDYWLRAGLVVKLARIPMTLANWRKRAGQGTQNQNVGDALQRVQLISEFYARRGLPREVLAVERQARCWSWVYAGIVMMGTWRAWFYWARAFTVWPPIVVQFNWLLWAVGEVVRFLKRRKA